LGKKGFKIGAQQPAQKISSKIPAAPQAPINAVRPSFSFGCFDESHSTFSTDAINDASEWKLFFKHLKSMDSQTWGEIKAAHQFHAHEIVWKDTTHPAGFIHLNTSLREYPAFQFKAFKEGRVIGFFMHGVFQIVWLDRYHTLYPGR
jgi:hypothetical protein